MCVCVCVCVCVNVCVRVYVRVCARARARALFKENAVLFGRASTFILRSKKREEKKTYLSSLHNFNINKNGLSVGEV